MRKNQWLNTDQEVKSEESEKNQHHFPREFTLE
jgi:hypothetical protein